MFFLFSLNTYSQECSYFKDYPDECKDALSLYHSSFHQLSKLNKYSGFTNEFIWSIVAPEITQYNNLGDKFETYSLKVLYVQNGKGYSDFSIGYFQMKPSFIEQLESYVESNSKYKRTYKDYLFKHPNSKEARVKRIERLEDKNWQIKYLLLFCQIVKDVFPEIEQYDNGKKLRFYSTAYNSGFLKKKDDLIKYQNYQLFPYFSLKKYNYSLISVCFYEQLKNGAVFTK